MVGAQPGGDRVVPAGMRGGLVEVSERELRRTIPMDQGQVVGIGEPVRERQSFPRPTVSADA